MSIYDPLRAYLNNCKLQALQMSFGEIEKVLGRPLPPAAHRHLEWWANEEPKTTTHVQCRAWQAAGYTAEVALPFQRVTFKREKSK